MKKTTTFLIFVAIAVITFMARQHLAPTPQDLQQIQADKASDAKWAAVQESHEKAALADRLSKCEVWIGMSRAELIKSWGAPRSTNATTTASSESHQLVYVGATSEEVLRCGQEAFPERAYVYVAGGVVTAIQAHQ